jgi:hypothetical protein
MGERMKTKPKTRKAPAASHPDAHLLRLGAKFDRLHAEWLPLNTKERLLGSIFHDEVERRGISADRQYKAWCKLRDETGYEAAIGATNDVLKLIDDVIGRIYATRPTTIAGIVVWARAVRFNVDLSKPSTAPAEDQDWDFFAMNNFVATLERLAEETP